VTASSPEIQASAPWPISEDSSLVPVAVDQPERSDHELMLAVRAGEIDRLGDLFERYHRPLYGFIVRLTSNRTASEDLVQLVFFRILKYRHTYRDEGKFSAWIYHLARKVVADHFRKNASAAISRDPVDLNEFPDHAPHAADRAATKDDLSLMQVALAQLPLDQREVLTLHRFQNLRHEEIGRLLDCSAGAVKVRVHRALSALRELYFKLRHEKLA
jgi:RNA polymerase sigma factor (sigma-70 family)